MVVLDQQNQPINPSRYASFSDRLLAGFIDAIIISAIYGVVSFTSFGLVGTTVVTWLYYAFTESSTMQASLGKSAMGLKVVDVDGRSINFWRASARYLIRFLSFAVFFIGVFVMFFNERRQTLHDILTNTVVLKKF